LLSRIAGCCVHTANGHTARGCRRAAEQRDELAPLQLIELHSVPYQPGPDRRISNWQGSVTGMAGIKQVIGV